MRLRRWSEDEEPGAGAGAGAPASPSGLEEPGIIDLITREFDGCIGLLMIENRPWDGGRPQVDQLLAKVTTYVEFATEGRLVQQVPAAEDQPVRVVLNTVHPPEGEAVEALRVVEEGLADVGIDFEVRSASPGGL